MGMLETLNIIFWICMFGCGLMIGLLWNDKEQQRKAIEIVVLENKAYDLKQLNYDTIDQYDKKIEDLHKEIDRLHRKYGD